MLEPSGLVSFVKSLTSLPDSRCDLDYDVFGAKPAARHDEPELDCFILKHRGEDTD